MYQNEFPNDFLKVLLKANSSNSNPFQNYFGTSKSFIQDLTSIYGFYEDSIEKEVRCPICLGRTVKATRPSNCRHVFCNYCLKKWYSKSCKCPICRVSYNSLIRVDISDKSISSQGNLFISY